MNTNLQFFLNSYADLVPTTAPSQNNFKWLREINGIPFNTANSQQVQVPTSTTTTNLIPLSFLELEATTTANINNTNTLVVTSATTGIVPGLLIVGTGIPANTLVDSVSSLEYTFTVTSANATAGATYTNNGQTFTVVTTLVAGTTLICTGTGAPAASGTLTLASGTGDATITFSSFVTSTNITMSNNATATTTGLSVSFYLPASFVYMESDQPVSVIYNGGTAMAFNPFQINGLTQPAVFFIAGAATSLMVTNSGTNTANVFFACMG
jgi:hypothetical protein